VYDEKVTFQLKSPLFRAEKVAFSLFSHPYFLLEFGLRNATLKDDFLTVLTTYAASVRVMQPGQ
jgi:hypothetical protein